MTCNQCNCSPCQCAPAVLNNPQIISGVFDGPTINGATINGGTQNAPTIIGADIDCTSQVCTQPAGICNESIASTAFVCTAIVDAISSSNPAFCQAISDCLLADPTALCPIVATCINTTPGIINTTSAFGIGSRATTALYGSMRYATLAEFNNGNCLLGVDPCTLIAALGTPLIGSAFFNAFTNAVNTVISGGTFCATVAACGFALLNSPAFIGTPTAPTPPAGNSSTRIATTAFVATAVANAISASNPAFCAAVTSCGGGGGGGGGGPCGGKTVANGSFSADGAGLAQLPIFISGATYGGFGGTSIQVNLSPAQPDANYSILLGAGGNTAPIAWVFKTPASFQILPGAATIIDWAVVRDGNDSPCP